MQTLLTAIGKMRGCVRQVENLNPSGASEQDIFNRAKVLFAQDKNYKKGFKFDHVWPILKDIEKFADVNAGIQVGRMQHGNFASSQSEYSPTSDSPTQASPGLASFDFNMNDNDFGGTSTERPIGVRKAKFKKRNDEESSKFMEYMKEENQKMLAIMEKNNADRQLNYEIQMLRAQTAAKKVDVEELREENLILLKDLTQVTDPKLHEFLVQEQSRIMHKRTKQCEGSQNTGSGIFAQYFEHLRPSDDNFPEY
ncbi:uncharacterized protein LOC109827300 [Asparagus officinalis]|uniref:uncharacterized protein LOC109827300 n=1 Tax=Asparagus officinalis TaxID=4686 RepID=UPI00098E0746|nr:uncharacterized protein LOC109827300 [Asparagus officinalis]